MDCSRVVLVVLVTPMLRRGAGRDDIRRGEGAKPSELQMQLLKATRVRCLMIIEIAGLRRRSSSSYRLRRLRLVEREIFVCLASQQKIRRFPGESRQMEHGSPAPPRGRRRINIVPIYTRIGLLV